ncbi:MULTISPECIES: DUF6344 domain-containing protein [Streptomyces]|uniref:Uncharacterized protein n=2 Tax=Streptomyces TaxID=1883 RepID=A0A100Y351_9ACTN|nr:MULTISPECIES: DUF6344 domain-containing protein [Streptomyces]KUH36844.1 hypothetical protein ATE80_21265 [Streptomyces kanasensis]UUS31956.1 DUF6344 domain-containing protein [Streptomyces changanensis]
MAAVRIQQFWTAIVSFFCGVLASLRRSAPTAGPVSGRPPAAGPASAAVALPGQRSAAPTAGPVPSPVPGRAAAGERALPPTIKQRIRAEAHGSSPAVRRMRAARAGDTAAAPAGDVASARVRTAPAHAGTASAPVGAEAVVPVAAAAVTAAP